MKTYDFSRRSFSNESLYKPRPIVNSQINKKDVKKGKHLNIKTVISLCFIAFIVSFVFAIKFREKCDVLGVVKTNLGIVSTRDILFETYKVSLSNDLESKIQEDIKKALSSVEFNGIKRFEILETAEDETDFTISVSSDNKLCTSSIAEFLPVGEFHWINDTLKSSDLSKVKFITLEKYKTEANYLLSTYKNNQAIVTKEKISDLKAELGKSENIVGLVKLSDLDPDFKLLFIDKDYFFDDQSKGKLSACLKITAKEKGNEYILNTIPNHINALYNDGLTSEKLEFKEDALLSLRMTGVTAISRNLASKIEKSGDSAYPAEKIGAFLSKADITHTSNEVSFVPGCTPTATMSFCANPKYIETMKKSGIDIVELTGNHNNDYGSQYNYSSIETYESLGWKYFGGGKNKEDSSKILYVEQDGTKIAFIGYNYYDTMLGTGALAGDSRAGANSYSESKMEKDIKEAKENANVVIVDFQFQECYSYPASDVIFPICYEPLSNPDQKGVFTLAIDYGADIVVGTQAHQPQTFEKYKEGYIFYGLGNLYFDQTLWIGTRQGLILTHYFINGKHVQTRLDTTIYDLDMKPYVTYDDARELLLRLLSEAR